MELDFRNRNSGRQPFSDFLKRRFPLFTAEDFPDSFPEAPFTEAPEVPDVEEAVFPFFFSEGVPLFLPEEAPSLFFSLFSNSI